MLRNILNAQALLEHLELVPRRKMTLFHRLSMGFEGKLGGGKGERVDCDNLILRSIAIAGLCMIMPRYK